MRLAFLISLTVSAVQACTTLVGGRNTTVDGSTFCTHSNDGDGSVDPRMIRIPPADHPNGSLRPVYFSPEIYPRYVGAGRAEEYLPRKGQAAMAPIGSIPQVQHTFGYFEGTYGTLNEKQVGIGESTCSGIYGAKPIGQGGRALFSVDELSQIAMERASTSREAVQLMGSLGEEYGFYGAGSFEGTAESLLVIDPTEAFVFHILPDPSGASAIWAAQRLADDEVAVVANMFIIREIDCDDSFTFLCSKNIYSIAEEKKLWDPSTGKLDFTLTYSAGEYAHRYHSGRRMWRAMDLFAPSLKLDPNYENLQKQKPYPFSVKPDRLISLEDIAFVMRDHYEGTEFDMTKGVAAGPFGSPQRYGNNDEDWAIKGNWERSIGLYRTDHSTIVQARSWLPDEIGGTVWWGPHAAHGTVYTPFVSGMAATEINPRYSHGTAGEFDRYSAWWAHKYVINMAEMKYGYIIEVIKKYQQVWESRGLALQKYVDSLFLTQDGAVEKEELVRKATFLYNKHSEELVKFWWDLPDRIIFSFGDGFIYYEALSDGSANLTTPGYPIWWLEDAEVGYTNGPPPPPLASPPAYAVEEIIALDQ